MFDFLSIFTRCKSEDMTLLGNSYMLKKYNVTVRRIHVYNVLNKQTVCNTTNTIDNSMFKCSKTLTIVTISLLIYYAYLKNSVFFI